MKFVILSITISANGAKTQELMRERTMSHGKQLRIHEATEGKRRRANPEEEAQRKQQKCDTRKQAASLSRTHKPPKQQRTMRMTMSHIEQL
jgi:pantothenate kinase